MLHLKAATHQDWHAQQAGEHTHGHHDNGTSLLLYYYSAFIRDQSVAVHAVKPLCSATFRGI